MEATGVFQRSTRTIITIPHHQHEERNPAEMSDVYCIAGNITEIWIVEDL